MNDETKKHPRRRRGRRGKKRRAVVEILSPVAIAAARSVTPLPIAPTVDLASVRARLHAINQRRESRGSHVR